MLCGIQRLGADMRRTGTSLIAALALLAAAPALAADKQFSIMGAGAQSCANYLKHTNELTSSDDARHMDDLYFSWAQGWMSQLGRNGGAAGAPIANLNPSGFGPPEQRKFLRIVCQGEPAIRYRDAVDRLYQQLLVRSAPQS
ncbi:MAG TPA: hypothetical protein DCL54_13700 [Alphaproteobacteria bacterium]|nr:hypothetical protein [Alphaproteobacteria bacterium]HAJ47623.1 hypothetical protein [Alphaproteobacteria bacterium]